MTDSLIKPLQDAPQDAEDAGVRQTVLDIIQNAEPRPVDRPEPAADGTWIAERQAYLAEAPPIVPPALRRWDAFTNSVRWTASYYGHVAGFHALRAPVYFGRLLLRAPRGTGRLIVRWGRWVADTEARPVEAKAAASGPAASPPSPSPPPPASPPSSARSSYPAGRSPPTSAPPPWPD
jgi:S-DNA-T family DNA segregation ATPase FtsK/SpoIIIE